MPVIRKTNTVTARQTKRWMKILVSLFLLLTLSAEASCRFKDKEKKFYFLSGPLTAVIEELGLLSSASVQGLSIFYPVPSHFKKEIIPGGLHLSPAKLDEMKNAIVFYDENEEMKKLFRARNMNAQGFVSRNLTPEEVVDSAVKILAPFLEDCHPEKISGKVKSLEEEIIRRMPSPQKIIFFLGDVNGRKLPELVIAHDGIVLWLKKKKLIQSYPSELAYLNWSAAIINRLEKDYLFLGLKEGPSSVTGNIKRATLTYPGGLIPGIHQLKAWKFFLDQRPR
jgi:hypothetical protein